VHVIKRLSQNYPVAIKATFLGAHAFPLEYKDNHQGYIDMLIDEIIPEIKLAQYIDVFVNQVTLLPRQNKLWKREFGLQPKIHVNQFNSIEEFNQGEIQCIICRSS
jgi:imidazolonepropionase